MMMVVMLVMLVVWVHDDKGTDGDSDGGHDDYCI